MTLSGLCSYIKVAPLWRKTESLLYKIELPLIAPRPYLLYQVNVHPVPIANSSFFVTMNLDQVYGLDTVSGNLFISKYCLGKETIICTMGPGYGRNQLQCAQGLITSRPELLRYCKTTIINHSGRPLIDTLALNQYALAT